MANDLLRLEALLSMVGKTRNNGAASSVSGGSVGVPRAVGGASGASVISKNEMHKRRDDRDMTVTSCDFSISRSSAGGLPRSRHHHGVSSLSVLEGILEWSSQCWWKSGAYFSLGKTC